MRLHRWDREPIGDWRPTARRGMERIAARGRADGLSPAEILTKIDAAYPWSPRKHHPYRIWLDERRRMRVKLGLLVDPRYAERVATGQRALELSI